MNTSVTNLDTSTANPSIALSIANARHKMIEQQIRPWSISDLEVLNVLQVIKREHFVTDSQINLAFMDIELPILNSGESMLEPKIEARILQALKPARTETVLEIGTGSGYMAALLAYFSKHVTSIEIKPELAAFAIENLQKSHIPNVSVETGDGAHGWDLNAGQSYDIICVSGGLPKLSKDLQSQLKIGGRLFAFVGQEPVMSAVLVTRISHELFQSKTLFETMVPMLKVPQDTLKTFVF
jgi:protein-L-isoaspartate(D-aspartate) O-methyltransferase